MINQDKVAGSVEKGVEISGTVTIQVPVVGTVSVGSGGGSKDAVLYVEQELTEDQKTQARANIGVIGTDVSGTVQNPYSIDQTSLEYTWLDPVTALEGAEILNCYGGDRDEMGIPDVDRNVATGFMSQASGFRTQARGNYSQARGWWTIADGQCSIAEGLLSRTEGHFCHAEGTRTVASLNNAHSEGDSTKATGRQSHSEGTQTTASGQNSHAEGYLSVSSGIASHAEGWGTVAGGQAQTAMGKFNIRDTSSRLIIGNGTSDTNRKNIVKVAQSGETWFAGDVYIKSSGGKDKDSGSKKLATEEYVDGKVSGIDTSKFLTMDYLENNIAQLILANLPIYEGEVEVV